MRKIAKLSWLLDITKKEEGEGKKERKKRILRLKVIILIGIRKDIRMIYVLYDLLYDRWKKKREKKKKKFEYKNEKLI